MNIALNDVGKLIELPLKPEWGPGKIYKIERGYAFVYFKNSPDHQLKKYGLDENPLQLSPNQTDATLDGFQFTQPKSGKKGKPGPIVAPMSFDQAVELFSGKYPLKFEDMGYLGGYDEKGAPLGERRYKEKACEQFNELFGGGQLKELLEKQEYPELSSRAEKILQAQYNLIFRFELISFHDFLKNSGPGRLRAYFEALEKALDGAEPNQESLQAYFETVNNCPTPGFAKWPNATLFLFLARPDRHFFLKPKHAQRTAAIMNMELNYEVKPNARTYACLLGIAREALEKLKPLGARDMIDVQSFFRIINR